MGHSSVRGERTQDRVRHAGEDGYEEEQGGASARGDGDAGDTPAAA